MVCTYSGVEVAKEDKVIAAVDVLHGIVSFAPKRSFASGMEVKGGA